MTKFKAVPSKNKENVYLKLEGTFYPQWNFNLEQF